MSQTNQLMVIGGQDAGKSTFRAQLYYRLEHGEGSMQLLKSVEDMTSIENDLDRLTQGLQLLHTNVDVYNRAEFTVKDNLGNQMSIGFADYGGEQIGKIGKSNIIADEWIERASTSSCWLFFMRIDRMRRVKTLATNPLDSSHNGPATIDQQENSTSSLQSDAIEVLQRLIFSRGLSLRHKLQTPKIGIFLSCWDELSEGEQKNGPLRVIADRCALFYQFIRSNWEYGQFQFWGLSSTESQLDKLVPNTDFSRLGPDRFGYVIDENMVKTSDLTVPILWLMKP